MSSDASNPDASEKLRPETIDLGRYRVPPGGEGFALSSIAPDDTQGLDDKAAAKAALKANRKRMAEMQERLYAEGQQSLLLVLQAMDTGGKDSTIRRVTKGLNPQGCSVASFKAPTPQEAAHDFLWRVHRHAPPKGHIRVFNRSHYEDVLIAEVRGWAAPQTISERYAHINAFERLLRSAGTRIVKVMLHISKAYQLERLRRRLRRPDKHWKFSPDDLTERKRWDAYLAAYEAALRHCSTEHAPWHVVPAERKWFRDLAVSRLLLSALEDMDPQYPAPSFDPADYPPDSLR